MANISGFARDIILASKLIYDGADPGTKITSPGFLRMLIDAGRPQILSSKMDEASGHVKDIKMAYRPRAVPGNSSDTLSCDADQFRLFNEVYITQSLFRQIAINFDFATVAKFNDDATAIRALMGGNNAGADFASQYKGGLFDIVWEAIAGEMNGLLGSIDGDLATKMALSFGFNQTTGLNTQKTVNFPLAPGQSNNLSQGMTMILSDLYANEMPVDGGNIAMVGSGLAINYWIQHKLNTQGVDASGLNRGALGLPEFYPDYYTTSPWGTNTFGLFDKRAIQFLDLNVNQGFRARELGNSFYFMLPMVITDSMGNTFTMNFDVQIKSRDCAETINNRYGAPITVGPGYTVYIRKPFDIFVEPGNMYDANDRLVGNNGTLKYVATNS